jgi:hypothetical protein
VFGLIYGKSSRTLGNDTKKAELDSVKIKINAAHKAGDKQAEAEHIERFEALLSEDRTEQAQAIIDKIFASFPSGHKWILRMQKFATEKFYVFSPIGRIRHLYAAITKNKGIVSQQVRRGMNAPIQGFASEIAVKASRGVMVSFFKTRDRLMAILGLKTPPTITFNRIVHDAQYFTVPYSMVLPFLHVMQYEATYGITKDYKDQFGLDFPVEPEIEVEFAVKDTTSLKWDYELPNLVKILDTVVTQGIAEGFLSGKKPDILKEIYAPWLNKESLKILNTEFPLLNVDLGPELLATARLGLKGIS